MLGMESNLHLRVGTCRKLLDTDSDLIADPPEDSHLPLGATLRIRITVESPMLPRSHLRKLGSGLVRVAAGPYRQVDVLYCVLVQRFRKLPPHVHASLSHFEHRERINEACGVGIGAERLETVPGKVLGKFSAMRLPR